MSKASDASNNISRSRAFLNIVDVIGRVFILLPMLIVGSFGILLTHVSKTCGLWGEGLTDWAEDLGDAVRRAVCWRGVQNVLDSLRSQNRTLFNEKINLECEVSRLEGELAASQKRHAKAANNIWEV